MSRWLVRSDPPVEVYDVALLDLDGVVYVGPDPVPRAVDAVSAAVAAGMRVAYVTNNASRPPAEVAEHLRDLGLAATAADVVTSAQAGAHLVADLVPAGSPVLALGGPGVAAALEARGLVPVGVDAAGPLAVLQGFGRDVGWSLLAEGAYALHRGVPWVATNTDLTIPTPGGVAPGNGTLVDVLRRTTGREPVVAGKPEPPLVRESIERTGAVRPLMVGDRLDTDIEGADRAGVDSLLVLTGVTDVSGLLRADPGSRPTLLALDLRGLATAHPPVVPDGDGWRCRSAVVTVAGGELRVTRVGDQPLDALRAACCAAWHATDRDQPPDTVGAVALLAAALANAAA